MDGLELRKPLFPRFQAYVESEQKEREDEGVHWLFAPAGEYTVKLNIRGHQLGILGLNTAWLSGSDADEHRLTPGKGILETGLAELKKSDTRIVLGHHPLDWFSGEELQPIRSLLGKNRAIYLHGHLHKTAGGQEFGAGYPFLSLQAGASFQAREDDLWVNRILWCALAPQEQYLEIEPWRWSRNYQEWVPDGDAFPGRYRQPGMASWRLPLPSL